LGGGDPVIVPTVKRAASDTNGAFFLCGVPRGVPVSVRIVGVNDPAMIRVVTIPATGFVTIADFNR
jgi:hypothetical protein